MRIGLVAPPFIEVPPRRYGGTELFLANLACELFRKGHEVVLYGNGESKVPCGLKWRYPKSDWPLKDPLKEQLKHSDHTSWAVHDAMQSVDVLHLNDVVGVPFTRFAKQPAVLTIHHSHEPALSEQYLRYPDVHYVTIAAWAARKEPMPRVNVVHHGLPLEDYRFRDTKEDYVAFLGRVAPCKGTHLAIQAARRAGIRLKLAGEVQPQYREYWEKEVEPRIDGHHVEYLGEADRALKNELLSKARALLFPIQWEEPFGLVMIEAMACGTPVLAFSGGAVDEVVKDGRSGYICKDVEEMAGRIVEKPVPAEACRAHVEASFSVSRMADQYLDVYRRALDAERA